MEGPIGDGTLSAQSAEMVRTMPTSVAEIVLDLDPDFDAVIRRADARCRLPWHIRAKRLEQYVPCGRKLAMARLWTRRIAAGRPGPGGVWNSHELLPLIEGELERMRLDGSADTWGPDRREEFLTGCGCYVCRACNWRTCKRCGGSRGGQCEVPAVPSSRAGQP